MRLFLLNPKTKAFFGVLLKQNVLSVIVTALTLVLISYAYRSEHFYIIMSIAFLFSLVLVAVDAKAKNDALELLITATSELTHVINVEVDEKEKQLRRKTVLLWSCRSIFYIPMIIIGLITSWHWSLYTLTLVTTGFWGFKAQQREKNYREYIISIHTPPN